MKTFSHAGSISLLVIFSFLTSPFAAVAASPVDSSFKPGTGLEGGDDGNGYLVVPLTDGRILVGGDFTIYDGILRPNLVRLHADGSLDESLQLTGGVDAEDEPSPWSAGFQPDGKIILSGNFTSISGVDRPGIARLNPDGTLDTEWVPQLRLLGRVNGIPVPGIPVRSVVQPDGRVLAWDYSAIERLNADGSADTSFNVDLGGSSLSQGGQGVSLQRDGRILLTGTLRTHNGAAGIARLNADGSRDESFAPRTSGGVYGAEEMIDGRILVFGPFDTVEGRSRRGLALLRSDGRLDKSARFEGERDYVWRARALSDGNIAAHFVRGVDIASGFDVTVFSRRSRLQGLKGEGGPWAPIFSVSLDGYVNDLAEDGSGRLLIVGEFSSIDGISGFPRIARLLSSPVE